MGIFSYIFPAPLHLYIFFSYSSFWVGVTVWGSRRLVCIFSTFLLGLKESPLWRHCAAFSSFTFYPGSSIQGSNSVCIFLLFSLGLNFVVKFHPAVRGSCGCIICIPAV